jgi:hypothetical protein
VPEIQVHPTPAREGHMSYGKYDENVTFVKGIWNL